MKPLDLTITKAADGTESHPHPYAFELESFSLSPDQLEKGELTKPRKLYETPLDVIETIEQLKSMIIELQIATEIAVDVEEYRYHSYQGLTCLVQISTRQKDYIIDAIELRDDLHELNEIFANPNIVKVLHGADGDVLWLQRDLSVYIVNMFDTHQACQELSFPKKSLAYLMEFYCSVNANKTKSMKTADWRVRPLSEELYTYAREDTHYLLYIFDCLRHALLEQSTGESNLLKVVYDLSLNICKRPYEKPRIKPDSIKRFATKNYLEFNSRQMYVLEKLYLWRDKVAREKDEGCGVVLPNMAMIRIAQYLPVDPNALSACCKTDSHYVRQYAKLLCGFSLMAVKKPLEAWVTTKRAPKTSNTQESDRTSKPLPAPTKPCSKPGKPLSSESSSYEPSQLCSKLERSGDQPSSQELDQPTKSSKPSSKSPKSD